ncbi:antitoxin Xre/MbcA/ParS toxin-binding domain-containing protein [Dokdonia ponticola]|uniref:Antitoxin Xre/MbcA/ParS toxin-binding domain-containing protein n=1 Tax=Dokdonia ponticola TaxID=2041041 RepID=A0ABV9HZR0_9FLAO
MSDDTVYNTSENLVQNLVSGSDIDISGVSEPAVIMGHTPVRDRSTLRLVHVSREGLSYPKFLLAVEAFDFSKQELAQLLHISERTLERIHKDKKRLSTPQTERILEVSILFEKGWDFFGSKEAFRKWLSIPNYAFENQTPLSMLDTKYGIDSVEVLLDRMAHGIVV